MIFISYQASTSLRPPPSQNQNVMATHEDPQIQFHDEYRDEELVNMHDRVSDTTLVFVRLV